MADKENSDNEIVFEFDLEDSAEEESSESKATVVEITEDESDDNPLSHMLDNEESVESTSEDEDLFETVEEKDTSEISFDLDAAEEAVEEPAKEEPQEEESIAQFETDDEDEEEEESFEDILKARKEENPQGIVDVKTEFATEEETPVEEPAVKEPEEEAPTTPEPEEPAAVVEEIKVEEAPAPKKPKKKLDKAQKEKMLVNGLAGLVGLLFLGIIANIFIGSDDSSSEVNISPATIKSLVKQQEKILDNKKKKAPAVDNSRTFWQSDVQSAVSSGKLHIASNQKNILAFTLNIETTPPPELSGKEMAAGIPHPAWLERLEMEEITEVLKQPESSFAGEAGLEKFFVTHDAKAYIDDHGGKNYRMLATASISGEIDRDNNVIKGRWTVVGGLNPDQKPSQNSVSRLDGDKFQLLYTETFEANLDEELNAQEAKKTEGKKTKKNVRKKK